VKKNARPSSAARRLRRMHDQLLKTYGPQHWWPAKATFEIVLGAYLTQNTAWKAVERSLANLRAQGALSLEGIRAIPLVRLQELIRPSGFYTRKAPAMKAFVAMLDAEFGGSLQTLAETPTAALRARLLQLPGVGPETADAILLYALHHPVPVADEYLRRIAERHKLIEPPPGKGRGSYEALVHLTRQAFSQDAQSDQAKFLNEFHALIVAVGKTHCRRTALCTGCPLHDDLLASRSAGASRRR